MLPGGIIGKAGGTVGVLPGGGGMTGGVGRMLPGGIGMAGGAVGVLPGVNGKIGDATGMLGGGVEMLPGVNGKIGGAIRMWPSGIGKLPAPISLAANIAGARWGGGVRFQQREQGREVAAYYSLAVVVRHQQPAGVAYPHGADGAVAVLQRGGDGLRAGNQLRHPAESGGEFQPLFQPLFHQMRQHFAVGFRAEPMSLGGQAAFQRQIVLDDAVVHQGDAPPAVGMRMGVMVGRAPVGGPAGMPQAEGALGGRAAAGRLQPTHLAHGARNMQPPGVIDHGDAGAVVAAVFQPLQPGINQRPGILPPHIANDSAHRPTA